MNKMISPGVFTQERDQSFLQSGTADASGSIVGPTARGPAFEPVRVNSPEEYIRIFGQAGYYTDIAALDYLRSADSITVVRILGGGPSAISEGTAGYSTDLYELSLSSPDGSAEFDGSTVALLAPTSENDVSSVSIGSSSSANGFTIDISDSGGNSVNYAVSLNPADNNYIADLFGTTAAGPRKLYVLSDFTEFHEELFSDRGPDSMPNVEVTDSGSYDFSGLGYTEASTPWIVSQDTMENQEGANRENIPLFRFHTQSHGDDANREVKVAIEDIVLPENNPSSPYATFSVVVREFNDTDQNPVVLETFTDLNLDPASDKFIGRKIGNKKTQLTRDGSLSTSGLYENLSDFIRVEVNEDIIRANERNKHNRSNLLPWGFSSYEIPFEISNSLPHGLKTRTNQKRNDDTYSSLNTPDWESLGDSDAPRSTDVYLGFDFSYRSNLQFLRPVPNDNSSLSGDYDFDFNISDSLDGRVDTVSEFDEDNNSGTRPSERKFVVAFQGGFDGMAPSGRISKGSEISATDSQGFDCSTVNSQGTLAYKDAFNLLTDAERYDIDLLVTPGIINTMHPEVVRSAIRLCEERRDVFYVLDPAGPEASVREAVNSVRSLSSSYAAAYFPWIRTMDSQTNRIETVPPSALIPRVFAFSDSVADPWYAAAGLTRGGIPAATEATQRLNKAKRDELYAGRVNPIAEYSSEGVVVFGQKTLYAEESALNRINVRRMIIKVKKFINMMAKYVTFEQNTSETRGALRDSIEPYLNRVKQRSGLYAFRLKIDAELNTPDVIDRGIIKGEIYLQPARTSEFVTIGLNIQNTGATFDEEETRGA